MKKVDLIRSNPDIRDLLLKRITDQMLTLTQVENDAKLLNRPTIRKERLSNYFNESGLKDYALTQQDIIWLCDRYNINIQISSKLGKYDNRTRKQYIKRKYDH